MIQSLERICPAAAAGYALSEFHIQEHLPESISIADHSDRPVTRGAVTRT